MTHIDPKGTDQDMQPQADLAADAALHLSGHWTLDHMEQIETLVARHEGDRFQKIVAQNISRIDTAGAFMLARLAKQKAVTVEGLSASQAEMFLQIGDKAEVDWPETHKHPVWQELLIDCGKALVNAIKDLSDMARNLGHILVALYNVLVGKARFRLPSIIYHIEHSGLRAVPIILLMSFLIGGIIAQQAAYQLRFFGAELLTVDLAGILIMREIGLLLAAIMFAGRSGSAFTAELGSMKMREEIDALKTMGLDPVEVLAVPRVIALIIALPLLTIVANGAALSGALLVSWAYSGIEPIAFVTRLRDVITVNVFFVGLIKAPLMALVIGIVAYMEGMKTKGSAESLGQQVTTSVVKAIFMVIVMDGIFAILFAAFNF